MEIVNDRIVAEEILNNGFKRKIKVLYQLESLIRYLHYSGWEEDRIKQEVKRLLIETINKYHFIDEVNMPEVIDSRYRKALSQEYKGDKFIPITEKEVEAIKSAGGIASQRLLFSMLCFQKFETSERGFMIVDLSDFHKEAQTNTLARAEKDTIFREMYDKKLIDFFVTTNGRDFCTRVLLEEGGEALFNANNYEPFGKQWMEKSEYNKAVCVECGETFYKKAGNETRCPDCQKKFRKTYVNEKVRVFRDKQKQTLPKQM